jgi:hypothetical protein
MNPRLYLELIFWFVGAPILAGLVLRRIRQTSASTFRALEELGRYFLFAVTFGFLAVPMSYLLLDGLNACLPRYWQFRGPYGHAWFLSAMSAGVAAWMVSRYRAEQHEKEKKKLVKHFSEHIEFIRPYVAGDRAG